MKGSEFIDWFISGFNREHTNQPDWKKMTLFPLVGLVLFIGVYETISKGYNESLFTALLFFMGSILGIATIPFISGKGVQLKQAEMDVATKVAADDKEALKKRALAVGLPETATKEEIEVAEKKQKDSQDLAG